MPASPAGVGLAPAGCVLTPAVPGCTARLRACPTLCPWPLQALRVRYQVFSQTSPLPFHSKGLILPLHLLSQEPLSHNLSLAPVLSFTLPPHALGPWVPSSSLRLICKTLTLAANAADSSISAGLGETHPCRSFSQQIQKRAQMGNTRFCDLSQSEACIASPRS